MRIKENQTEIISLFLDVKLVVPREPGTSESAEARGAI